MLTQEQLDTIQDRSVLAQRQAHGPGALWVVRESANDVPALLAELAEARNLLADLVIKATEYGTQDGDFVASYLLPTGPLHRAMPWLEQRGIVVRPGFDGRKLAAAFGAGLSPDTETQDQATGGAPEPHRCPTCNELTTYQRFSGGREYYCAKCDDHGMYQEGDVRPPRVQMLADGKVDELRGEMREEIAKRKAAAESPNVLVPLPGARVCGGGDLAMEVDPEVADRG